MISSLRIYTHLHGRLSEIPSGNQMQNNTTTTTTTTTAAASENYNNLIITTTSTTTIVRMVIDVGVIAGGTVAIAQKVNTRLKVCNGKPERGGKKRHFYKCINLQAQQHNWTLSSRCHSLSMTWQQMCVCRCGAGQLGLISAALF